MNSRKHEEILCVARSESKSSGSVRMSCVRMVLAAFALLLSLHAHAQQGYAVLSADGTTLTFKYGTPTGTVNVDYYDIEGGILDDINKNIRITKVVFEPSFASARPQSCSGWFYGMSGLTTIQDIQYLNTSEVTMMTHMFNGCSSLKTLDVSRFNTSKVGNMNSMFNGCYSLTSLDVSKFDTSKVIDMSYMFYQCRSLSSLDVSKFNTSNVRNMSYMFYKCNSLPSLDVSKFSTSNVTDMKYMFYQCSSLTSLDVSKFDTSNVTDMKYMFYQCRSLTSLDVSKFSTSNVTDMRNMFYHCRSLPSLDVSKFNTSNVIDMSYMFSSCSSLKTLDVSKFNTSKVIDMTYMFNECSSLTSLNVSKFDTRQVKNMSGMFGECSSLRSLDVRNFVTSQVAGMSSMFRNCSSLPSLDLSKFETTKVINMTGMFEGCSSLTSLDISNFNTSKVTNLDNLFAECEKLTSLNVSSFDTSQVQSMFETFQNCRSLTSLDISNFNTSNVYHISGCFVGCQSLTSLDLRNFDTSKARYMRYMFMDCLNLKCVVFGKKFSMGNIDSSNYYAYMSKMFDNCPSLRYVDFFLSDDTDVVNSANVASMFKGAPATTVVYLPHGSQALTTSTNIVYSYNGNQNDLRCPMYYSVDKVDIEFPRQFRTNEALYDRTATMGSKKYGSATLPFAFTSNSDIQAYALTKQVKQNGKATGLTFTNVSTVARHTPFVFLRKGKAEFRMKDASGNFGITVYPVRSTNKSEKTWTAAGGAPEATPGSPYTGSTGLSNWKTKGYYVKETVNDYNGMFFVQDNEFKRAVGPLNLVDHRVLFYPTDGSGAASVFSLSFEDEDDIATAIEEAETEQTLSEATEIYDASGCRLSEARKGLNIIRMSDGTVKKVFIK